MPQEPATLQRDMAHTVNLMAHPTAAFAAASAIGLGMASQVAGLWLGAMAGAMEVTLEGFERARGGPTRRVETPSPAARRARVATRTLIEDARSLAREISEAGAAGNAPATVRPKQAPSAAAVAITPARDAALVRPSSVARPARPDDLKAISGIGPKLEQVLNGLGVWTYAQVAAWTPVEVAWVDDQLGFAGRIGRDDWIGQAARLARRG